MNKTATVVIIIIILGLGVWLLTKKDNAAIVNTDDSSMAGTNDVSGMDSVSDQTPDSSSNPNSSSDDTSGLDDKGTDISGGITVTTGKIQTFTITADNYAFSTKAMTVNKGDTVRITLKSSNGTHDLKVDGYDVKTDRLSSGEEDTIEFVADKAGTFEFYCTYGNHRAMGMKGTLTVK